MKRIAWVVVGLGIITAAVIVFHHAPAAPEKAHDTAEQSAGPKQSAKPAVPHMQAIAKAYAARARFPDWSVPLSDKDWTLLHPNAYTPVAVPITVDGATLHVSISLPHATLFSDQSIEVTADFSGPADTLAGVASVDASIRTLDGKELAHFPLAEEPGKQSGTRAFSGSEPGDAHRDWPRDLRVRVTAQIGSQTVGAQAPFRFQPVQAILTGVGASYVDGAVLRIPLQFDVSHPGYYRVQANLLSQDGKQPIAHLTTEGQLSSAGDELSLHCHASVLRSLHAPGPYQLSGFLITHLPDAPGDLTMLGRSAKASFQIVAHPLSEYAHTPYVNQIDQERQHFLQQLGAGQ